MKLRHIVSAVFLIGLASSAEIDEKWKRFKKDFNKRYESEDENYKRFKVFEKNCQHFSEHNERFSRGKTSFTMDVNRDADLTFDEIEEREGAAQT